MSAQQPGRRKLTAREAAEKYGVSTRTVRRLVAEPRQDFLNRAAARRAQAVQLRLAGATYAEIAEAMGCSTGSVGSLLHDARRRGEMPEPTADADRREEQAAS
ncbi:helix-turn-helix domain-containing protein [Kineococcus sp. SYSU DK004]|uniref:helix-turn-helix domain-containing protein n=1 Tax=Kineococcus sp. SYSU DK004 TaxID=3383125 RepID=UPI003D7DB2E5